MVRIRLSRRGPRNKPFYRVVAISEKVKKSAPALEILGSWNPVKKKLEVDRKQLEVWLNKGAQLSAAVSKLLKENK